MECAILYQSPQHNGRCALKRSEHAASGTAIDDKTIFTENSEYHLEIELRALPAPLVQASLMLNGQTIGHAYPKPSEAHLHSSTVPIEYSREVHHNQPFSLLYDLAQFTLNLDLLNGESLSYSSPHYLCKTSKPLDRGNIQQIIKYLSESENSQIGQLVFSHKIKGAPSEQIFDDMGHMNAYQSMKDYISLIEEVVHTYQAQQNIFLHQIKGRLSAESNLMPFHKVKKLSAQDIKWMLQNPSTLHETQHEAIPIRGRNYLPSQILSSTLTHNYDIYENQIVLSFLHSVAREVNKQASEFAHEIAKKRILLDYLKNKEQGLFQIPALTIMRLQLEHANKLLAQLHQLHGALLRLLRHYEPIMRARIVRLVSLPRSTKIFQEIMPYKHIYHMIAKWHQLGSFSIERETLLLKIQKMDKLYELFCLYRLLDMLLKRGFIFNEEKESYYEYPMGSTYATGKHEEDDDVANTYQFKRGEVELTLYYQPVIYTDKPKNGITLFRTSCGLNLRHMAEGEWREQRNYDNHFQPDFLVKIMHPLMQGTPLYIIFDAKYANFDNVVNNLLDKCISKYCIQIWDSKHNANTVKMMWLLQGRITPRNSRRCAHSLHNSRSTRSSRPPHSIGIYQLNTADDPWSEQLWKEMKRAIPFL